MKISYFTLSKWSNPRHQDGKLAPEFLGLHFYKANLRKLISRKHTKKHIGKIHDINL